MIQKRQKNDTKAPETREVKKCTDLFFIEFAGTTGTILLFREELIGCPAYYSKKQTKYNYLLHRFKIKKEDYKLKVPTHRQRPSCRQFG